MHNKSQYRPLSVPRGPASGDIRRHSLSRSGQIGLVALAIMTLIVTHYGFLQDRKTTPGAEPKTSLQGFDWDTVSHDQ